MENMDQAPYLMREDGGATGMGDAQIYDSMLRDGLNDAFSGEHSGWHTEDLVTRNKITREDQESLGGAIAEALAAAQTAGRFAAEIVGVEVKGRKGPRPLIATSESTGNDAGGTRQAQTGVSQGRHDHRRECAGAQQRCGGDGRRGTGLRRA